MAMMRDKRRNYWCNSNEYSACLQKLK